MKLLFINGVNLNMTGMREKGVYGTETLDVINSEIAAHFKNDTCKFYQSNFEGDICTELQKAPKDGFDGVILNAGAFTHYSYAIRDALASVPLPKVEIHISDITQREEFRKISVTAPVCDKQIYGRGLEGYLDAIDFILDFLAFPQESG